MLAFARKHAYNQGMRTQHLLKVMPPMRVASVLNIRVQAVYQWGDSVPALRQYQLREYLAANEPEILTQIDAARRLPKRRRKSPNTQP